MYQFSNPQVQPIDVAGGVQNYLAMKQGREQQEYERGMKERAMASDELRVKTQKVLADLAAVEHGISFAEKTQDLEATNNLLEQVGSDIRFTALPKSGEKEKRLEISIPSPDGVDLSVSGDPEELRAFSAEFRAALQQNPALAQDPNYVAGLTQKYKSVLMSQKQTSSGSPESSSQIGKMIKERKALLDSGVKPDDPVIKAYDREIGISNNPENIFTDTDESDPFLTEDTIRQATGPMSAIRQGANNLLGFMVPGQIAPKTEAARNRLRVFNHNVKIGLVNNPKFTTTEQQTVAGFLPNPDEWMRDPDGAITKIKDLRTFIEDKRGTVVDLIGKTKSSSKRDDLVSQLESLDAVLNRMPDFKNNGKPSFSPENIEVMNDEEFSSFFNGLTREGLSDMSEETLSAILERKNKGSM